MMFSSSSAVVGWIGFRVVDARGRKIGRAEAYVAAEPGSDRDWILVRCGRLTNRVHRLVPFADAVVGRREIWMPVDRDAVMCEKSAEDRLDHVTA